MMVRLPLAARVHLLALLLCVLLGRPAAASEIYNRSNSSGDTVRVSHSREEVPPEKQRARGPNISREYSRLLYIHHYRFKLCGNEHEHDCEDLYTLQIEEFGPLFRVKPQVMVLAANAEQGDLVAVYSHGERITVLLTRSKKKVASASLPDDAFPGPDILSEVQIEGSPAGDDLRVLLKVRSLWDRKTRHAVLTLAAAESAVEWKINVTEIEDATGQD